MKKLAILLLTLLLANCLSGCGSSNAKEFKEAVDKFTESYKEYSSVAEIENKSETEMLKEDLALKSMVSSLSTISRLYEGAKKVTTYNDYLNHRIDYEMAEIAIQYDKNSESPRLSEEGALIDYLKDR